MPGSEVKVIQRTALYLTNPALWPLWPFIPVVRRSSGLEEDAMVYDARNAVNLTGYSATVFITNLSTMPDKCREFLKLPKEVFVTAEEMADAGWRVD